MPPAAKVQPSFPNSSGVESSNCSTKLALEPVIRSAISIAMPLICVNGNGIAQRSSASIAREVATPRAPAAIDASVWSAPFAAEVVPDVYRIQRNASGSKVERGAGARIERSASGSARSQTSTRVAEPATRDSAIAGWSKPRQTGGTTSRRGRTSARIGPSSRGR